MRFAAVPFVCALALALASSPSLAQTVRAPAPDPSVPAPLVVYTKTTALVFTEAHVDGALVRPTVEWTKARSAVKFRNLIELRASFRPELARSASRTATAP